MADKKYGPPGVDLLQEGSVDMESYRARRINSLHRSVDELVQEQNKKRLQVSNEVNGLTKQQQKMMAQLEFERGDMTNDVAKGYSNVLQGLGRTINSLATGVKNITVDTGKATSDAISQYGKAIGEDISINKTNTVAMALSKATPLFGYFAAKFMETDVFKDAAGKIKNRVGSAMSEGLSKAGDSISNIFRKGKSAIAEEKNRQPATVADLESLKNDMDLPHLQEGGYVREGGIVEVHAAEVVTPIDKLLKQLDESKNADIARKLNATLSVMSERMNRMETVVVRREDSQKGLIQTFLEEFSNAKDTRTESFQNRLLKGVLELKVALVGTTSRMRIAWQRTLLQHPAFRNMLMFSEILQSAIISPLQFLFGVRGGYGGKVRRATQTHNVFQKISNLLSITYTTLMPKIDELIAYTKATAEAITGGPVSKGATAKTYTMFGKIKESMTSRSIVPSLEGMFDSLVERLGLDKDAMGEAGISSFSDFLRPKRIAGRMGFTKENIKGKFSEKMPGGGFWEGIKSEIVKLREMKEDQEKREGPHSPSMAENIASTAKATEGQLTETIGLRKKIKKFSNKLWDIAFFAFGFLKDLVFKSIVGIKNLISPILTFFTAGAGTAVAGGKMGAIGTAIGAGASKVGGAALSIGGGMAAITAGAAIGGGMGLWDMFQAIKAGEAEEGAEGFVGNWLIRGIAGFLGGTGSGAKGAAWGAVKGAALGAAAGSVVPVLGTALGAAIGAGFGGLYGFLGGKDLSRGMKNSLTAIADFAKGTWKIVTFPMKMFREGMKATWSIAKWGFNKVFGDAIDAFKDWWNKPGYITNFLHSIINFFKKILDFLMVPLKWISDKFKQFFGAGFWETIKNVIHGLLFPLETLSKAVKWIDKKLEDSFVGSIYKKIKEVAGAIDEGTFSRDLERQLNGNNRPTEVLELIEKNPSLKKDIISLDAVKRARDLEARRRQHKELAKELNKRAAENTKATNNIIKSTSQNVVTSNSSNVSTTNNGGGMGSSFSSSDKFARDVTFCNLS
jgi:hypothetical protein